MINVTLCSDREIREKQKLIQHVGSTGMKPVPKERISSDYPADLGTVR